MTDPGPRTRPSTSTKIPIPADDAEHGAEHREHHTDPTVQPIGHREAGHRCCLSVCALARGYSPDDVDDDVEDVDDGAGPPVSRSCRSAAAPIRPPMPMDSTALLGI